MIEHYVTALSNNMTLILQIIWVVKSMIKANNEKIIQTV